MKKSTSQSSRKASENRAEQVSTQAAVPSYQVIKLGVDTHGGQYVFARMIDHQGVQPPQKMLPMNFLEFLKKQQKLAPRVVMVYEAGPYGFALQRQAAALGVECLVCAPERLSRGRKRVNDKIDAAELLSRLDRYLAGNTTALRIVHVPTIAQEISRRLSRERNTYRKERQRWMARGRSLFHSMGVCRPGKWWEPEIYSKLLERLATEHPPEFIEPIRSELDRYIEMYNQMDKKLDELTAQLCKSAIDKSTTEAGQLPRIKGIGHLSQEMLDREMTDWHRFGNRRAVASYTGLCPGEDSTGDSQRSLSIDKHGNPRVRMILVELAWMLPRYQPTYRRLDRWKWVFEKKTSKAMRKKAVVALARQLAVDLWRIKTGRATAADMGLKLVA
jgi:transposase